MRNHRGVSLVEVLVAAVLLTVGVGGSLNALVAAAALRSRAAVRESVAQALESRLAWFAASACGFTSDTVVRSAPGVLIAETWLVRRDSLAVRLEGRVLAGSGLHTVRRVLDVRRRCP